MDGRLHVTSVSTKTLSEVSRGRQGHAQALGMSRGFTRLLLQAAFFMHSTEIHAPNLAAIVLPIRGSLLNMYATDALQNAIWSAFQCLGGNPKRYHRILSLRT